MSDIIKAGVVIICVYKECLTKACLNCAAGVNIDMRSAEGHTFVCVYTIVCIVLYICT